MRISVLAENTAFSDAFEKEHGLSLYIETESRTAGKKLLFDFGQTALFARNAKTLGIDLAGVDLAVLSHGHYDHGGGISVFLKENSHAPIYVSKHAFGAYYNATDNYIGLDCGMQQDRMVLTGEKYELSENMVLFCCNEYERTEFVPACGLTKVADGVKMPDDFSHEQYLLLEENGKKILISGCSHKGILNLCRWFEPDICIGGFHFMKMEPDKQGRKSLAEIAQKLLTYPTVFYTCHCTGEEQYRILKEQMGDRLRYLSAGMQLTV